MLKLLKHLKKSVPVLLLIIALLGVQAACELSLPSYTSAIVDVGIQQNGVTDTIPEIIRPETLDTLLVFVDESKQDLVKEAYTPLAEASLSDAQRTNLENQYPDLATVDALVLTAEESDQKDEIASLLQQPLLILSYLRSDSEEMADAKEQMEAMLPPELAELSMEEVLPLLPAEAIADIKSSITQPLSVMPESIAKQGATAAAASEYEALGANMQGIQTRYIMMTGLKMLGLTLLSMAATILVGFCAARVSASLGMELRGQVFHKVLAFSNADFDRFSTASLITRSTNDIQQIQMMLVVLLRIVFYAPIIGIGGIFKVLQTNTSMVWIIAVGVMAILTLVIILFTVTMPKFKGMQKLVDRLNLVTREILTGLSVIRAFSTQKHEEKRFDKANKDLMHTQLFVNRTMALMMPTMMLLMNGITLLIVWNGAHSISDGMMQVGDMMAFIQYTMQVIMSFLMISMVSIMLPRASVSAGRIQEILESEVSVADPERPVSFPTSQAGTIEFRDVAFRYPGADENVLEHVSFQSLPGQTTAIIGSTGSGKSTLLNLIPRFYDVTEGSILINGVDIRTVTQHELHTKLGYVPQKGVLFSGTISSNLKYGNPDADDSQMAEAAEIAQSTDFIQEKEDQYSSPIAQGGSNVSGGQKQRLSIGRAILTDPEIYLFDDSFSALDYQTDVALRRALKSKTERSTVLIVAQRISTILHADQILVMDEGSVVGMGTHEELLQSCEVYQQIASSQLSAEELSTKGSDAQ